MTLNAKIIFFQICRRFWTATHISRANCAEIARDRPKQPEYEIFRIKRRFQRSRSRIPMFKETWAWGHHKRVPFKTRAFGLL